MIAGRPLAKLSKLAAAHVVRSCRRVAAGLLSHLFWCDDVVSRWNLFQRRLDRGVLRTAEVPFHLSRVFMGETVARTGHVLRLWCDGTGGIRNSHRFHVSLQRCCICDLLYVTFS